MQRTKSRWGVKIGNPGLGLTLLINGKIGAELGHRLLHSLMSHMMRTQNTYRDLRLFVCCIVTIYGCNYSFATENPPAFPGAEGPGSRTPGGRNGKVYVVTTLADYLPNKEQPITGSLRAAIESKGPRIIVFRVGGYIDLKANLTIRNPYITIAGQTAPGDGICLRNYQFGIGNTHDCIVRYKAGGA